MKAVILCGGMGFRLREETELKPKPMVEIGGKPILWHIMKGYAAHGVKDFILCLGYKGEVIKQYFLNYAAYNCPVTVRLGRHGTLQAHGSHGERDWSVTLVDTGDSAMTGSRLKRVEPFLRKDPEFLLTYGDGVGDVDIKALARFHRRHGRIGTITGVSPLSRFGELVVDKKTGRVRSFSEKPLASDKWINGGFFAFRREIFRYLSADGGCVLEEEPLSRLAREGQLVMRPHAGTWHCMDTYRDYRHLNELWAAGRAGWKTWR